MSLDDEAYTQDRSVYVPHFIRIQCTV